MSEVFDPEKVERWDCQVGQFLDGGTVAVMVGAEDGEYVYAWQFLKLLALYRELVPLPPAPSTLPTIAEMRGLLNR